MPEWKHRSLLFIPLALAFVSQAGGTLTAGASLAGSMAQTSAQPDSKPPPPPVPPSFATNVDALPICTAGANVAAAPPPSSPGWCRAPAGQPGRPFNNSYQRAAAAAGDDDIAEQDTYIWAAQIGPKEGLVAEFSAYGNADPQTAAAAERAHVLPWLRSRDPTTGRAP
jgi:hypothetical protein